MGPVAGYTGNNAIAGSLYSSVNHGKTSFAGNRYKHLIGNIVDKFAAECTQVNVRGMPGPG